MVYHPLSKTIFACPFVLMVNFKTLCNISTYKGRALVVCGKNVSFSGQQSAISALNGQNYDILNLHDQLIGC